MEPLLSLQGGTAPKKELICMLCLGAVGMAIGFALMVVALAMFVNITLLCVGVALMSASPVLTMCVLVPIWNCVRTNVKTKQKRLDLEKGDYLVGWRYEKQRWEEYSVHEYRRAVTLFNKRWMIYALVGM